MVSEEKTTKETYSCPEIKEIAILSEQILVGSNTETIDDDPTVHPW